MLKKKWIQHILAITAFLMVSLIFCKPVLEGKVLVASDNVQTIGGLKESLDYRKADNKGISWTNSMFGGMPLFHGINPNKIRAIPNILVQYEYDRSYDVLFFLMIGIYLLCISFKVPILPSFFVSVAFAFCGFNIMSMEHGHFYKIMAFSFLPGLMAGIVFLLRNKNYLVGGLVFIFYCNWLIGINHTQITYYGLIISFFLVLYYSINIILKSRDIKQIITPFLIMFLGFILALGSSALILNTKITAEETIRGGHSELSKNKKVSTGLDKDYASSWSMDPIEIFTFVIPKFAGGTSSNYLVNDNNSKALKALRTKGGKDANKLAQYSSTYWGNQPFVGGGFYMGSALFFIFLLYLFLGKGKEKYLIASLTLLILCFAFGKNFPSFYNLTFNHLPLYNKFRVPSMIVLVIQIFVALGAGLFLKELANSEKIDIKKYQITSLSIIGFLLTIIIFSPMFMSFLSRSLAEQAVELPAWYEDALRMDRIALMRKDGIKALFLMLIPGVSIWLYLSNKIKSISLVYAIVGVIVCSDLINNATNHIKWDKNESTKTAHNYFQTQRKAYAIFNETKVDRAIKKDTDIHYRVFDTTKGITSNAMTSYHHKSISGYHGAKLRRYQELIEEQFSKNSRTMQNMLNVKYLIGTNKDKKLIHQLNQEALGNAWFVDSISIVETGDEEMNSLNPPFNPSKIAIAQKKYTSVLASTSYNNAPTDKIQLISYHPDTLKYQYSSLNGGYAVFSEIFYKLKNGDGWKAYVDNNEVAVDKVNYVLRGAQLEAGNHQLKFIFHTSYYNKLKSISRFFTYLSMLVILVFIGRIIQLNVINRKSIKKA